MEAKTRRTEREEEGLMEEEVETELQKDGCRKASARLLKTQIPTGLPCLSPRFLPPPPPPPLPPSWSIPQGNLRIDDMSGILSGISAGLGSWTTAAKVLGITLSPVALRKVRASLPGSLPANPPPGSPRKRRTAAA